jgi:potassium/hydrogen antiporter
MDFTLMLFGLIILIGFAANLLFRFTKIPDVLFLIIIGILIGPILGIINPGTAMALSPIIVALMLIVVMLDNGLSFDIFNVLKTVGTTVIFAIGIMIITAISITAILFYLLNLSILEAALIGIMICGTSSDVITIIVSKMKFNDESKQLLILESVVNDLQIIPFFILLDFIVTSSVDGFALLQSIFFQIPFAIFVGVLAAFSWVYFIGKFLGRHPLNYMGTLAILFILYNIMQMFGSSGAITILSFSLVLGNALGLFQRFHVRRKTRKKFTPAVIRAFQQVEVDISFIVKVMFFVFLGIVFNLGALESYKLITSFVILAAVLVSRYIVVKFITRKSHIYKSSTGPLTWIMPRGYIAAVLAFAAFGSGMFSQQVIDIVLLNIFITTIVAILYSIYHNKRNP